tara:strand:- start:212 stop:427 length:216 start_codon:yes stop_codon:yes gene_type:complete
MKTENEMIIERAASYVGGKAALARLCGVSRQAVNSWRLTRIPAEQCLAIERATRRRITRYDLRSDIYPQND